MRTTTFNVFRFSPALALALMVTVGLMGLGCASIHKMRSGDSVPASQGTVKVTEGPNGNTALFVEVKHLAPPGKVASGASVYVVWIQPRDAAPQSVGALLLNEDLEGSLKTVTAHRLFQLVVTPEPSGQGNKPTNEPVFSFYVDRSK